MRDRIDEEETLRDHFTSLNPDPTSFVRRDINLFLSAKLSMEKDRGSLLREIITGPLLGIDN